jgi:hypothetical protein
MPRCVEAKKGQRFQDGTGLMVRVGEIDGTDRVHFSVIEPPEWFAPASTECREMFTDGHFYGCITVAQAVAEFLATKFLVEHHPGVSKNRDETWAEAFRRTGVITDCCCRAFLRILGTDRDDFHHLNKEVPTGYEKLESRAEECVGDLYDIESEIFGYDISDGGEVIPHHPQYWKFGTGIVPVFLRYT